MGLSLEEKIINTILSYINNTLEDSVIANPNVDFIPDGKDYIHIDLLSSSPAQNTFSGVDALRGTFQITVLGPKGVGVVKPAITAGKVAEAFPKGKRIFGDGVIVTIQERANVEPTFIDEAYTRTPITIRYIAC